MEVLPGHQTVLLELGAHHLIGRAGVGRGLQHDQGAGLEVAGDRVDRAFHRPQVRAPVLGQRGGHADDGHSRLGDLGLVGGGPEPEVHHLGDVGIAQVVDV